MKRIELTVWELGDRVVTAQGHGTIVRETPNSRAPEGAVGVRLDGDEQQHLLLGKELRPETEPHRYLSTGCHHGDQVLPDGRTGHEYCQGMTGYQGVKRGGRCKFCDAPCKCPCHQAGGQQ